MAKGKQTAFFFVRSVVMNLQNGWDSVLLVKSGTHLWKNP